MDEKWMQKAKEMGEVPVGAVIVKDGKLLCGAHNLREKNGMATAHAELLAIEEACRILGDWHLCGCTLYVTLEPCPMCAGAIINSRIDRVVFGAYDSREGSFGSLINLASYPYSSRPEIVGGVMETECKTVLSEFFKKIRENK